MGARRFYTIDASGNVIIYPCGEDKLPKNPKDRYTIKVSASRPECSDLCLALYYYSNCKYSIEMDETYMMPALEELKNSVHEKNRDEDTSWKFIEKHRESCMDATRAICEAVDNIVEKLEVLYDRDDNKQAKRALRVLNIYDIKTSQPPYEELTYNMAAASISFIQSCVGDEFSKAIGMLQKICLENEKARLSDEQNSRKRVLPDFFHQTTMLLECYKGFFQRKSSRKNANGKTNAGDESYMKKIANAARKCFQLEENDSISAFAAFKLVEAALESLKHYPENGDSLYKSIELTFLNMSPITKTSKEECGKSWRNLYDRRSEAINVLSLLLWGYSTNCVLDNITEDKKRRSKTCVSVGKSN